MSSSRLPSGTEFKFWDDATPYGTTYHVAQGHPKASDANPGTADEPFATIGRAAACLQPGEKVVVHEGVYRECVCPARGGDGPDRMVAYEGAQGERVVLSGSEPWQPEARASAGWCLPACDATVWMADLPDSCFGAYNPFLARNAYDYLPVYGVTSDADWMRRALLRRGTVFVDGEPLRQVFAVRELAGADGAFWVEEPGLRIHFRLPGDADTAGRCLEVTAREQVFAPRAGNLGFIRVSGFVLQHAANGLPVPQRGALSTNCGHHWIIEDCTVEWANGCGMDVGCQSWERSVPQQSGRHIIRRNAVRHCGVCGIAGARGVVHTLIEDNVIEHIGALNLERMWECGGIKFHFCKDSLFRRNVFRHLKHAGGIWLDVDNVNNRITNNVFADIESLLGAVYSEMNYEVNMVDHNVVWDVRVPGGESPEFTHHGSGLHCDCNEKLICAHNFFGKVQGDAVMFSLNQHDRKSSGRTGLCRSNAAFNNVFFACPRRVHLGRREENRSDGNLFDASHDACSFRIQFPEPGCYQDLARWQEFFSLDLGSTQAGLEAAFDTESLELTWRVVGATPHCVPVEALGDADAPAVPGPFSAAAWQQGIGGGQGQEVFPRR